VLRVVHLSTTPLVGAPGNICAALNQRTGVDARWCVLDPQAGNYAKVTFALDLNWRDHRDEVIDRVRTCDILHLHNYLDLQSLEFAPIDFQELWHRGLPMVRHFHSTPMFVAQTMRSTVDSVLACPIPKVVIAQYPERYLPTARLVPNLPFVGAPELAMPQRDRGGTTLRIGYAPSRFNDARTSRWDTKAYPETRRMLASFRRRMRRHGLDVEVDLIEQVPHAEALRRKQQCDLFIDDLVTGSYHLNTLEALACGIPCLTYLDTRIQTVLREISGDDGFPAVNVALEDAPAALETLCLDAALRGSLATYGLEWMHRHWTASWLADHFLDAYAHIRAQPQRGFEARFGTDAGTLWRVQGHADSLWASRRARLAPVGPPWVRKLRSLFDGLR